MHILLIAAGLAGFIAFAFGETAARVFIGALLGTGALIVLFFISVIAINGI
jgi:hypothetical protein